MPMPEPLDELQPVDRRVLFRTKLHPLTCTSSELVDDPSTHVLCDVVGFNDGQRRAFFPEGHLLEDPEIDARVELFLQESMVDHGA